ncbi:Alpha-L-arabinofuranosidase 1 [Hordeum vulgare]|nr:Alpha-L-arabinofuranosidase 1 [Hordeum vulgare]
MSPLGRRRLTFLSNGSYLSDKMFEPDKYLGLDDYYKKHCVVQVERWKVPPVLQLRGHRWRPETHSFHLALGEMTITLKDVAMISGLPIKGRVLTGKVKSEWWRQRVAGFERGQVRDTKRKKADCSG